MLAAVVEAEQIEPTDEEIREALAPSAERAGDEARRAARAAASRAAAWTASARTSPRGQALELLVREAKPISVEQAQAREKLWTPGSEGEQAGTGQLWTPGE